jgi:hypothetical protein
VLHDQGAGGSLRCSRIEGLADGDDRYPLCLNAVPASVFGPVECCGGGVHERLKGLHLGCEHGVSQAQVT